MADTDFIQPPSGKLKKALCWMSEMLQEHPEMTRTEVLRKAEVRFDLTPRECEFLDSNFEEILPENPC